MRIVIISDWFSENMGYAENCLPKAFASLGHEVHLITSNVQIYFNSSNYQEIYEPFIGPAIVACESKKLDGYTLHRLPYGLCLGRLRIQGLRKKLIELCPEIVQTFNVTSLTTLDATFLKLSVGYKLFLGSHVHASVFPHAMGRGNLRDRIFWPIYANTFGSFVSMLITKCYAISGDAAEIVTNIFGIEACKVDIVSLGVDTYLFYPPISEINQQVRQKVRRSLGFAPNEVVCIYTGRFSKDKNPLCLAQAIGKLVSEGHPFRGMFVGNGPAEDVEAIRCIPGNVIHPFVPVSDLPSYYWAADIGVWPKQESTSQLDAAACGLPIILSNKIKVLERVNGSGLLYEENNSDDLMLQIMCLSSSETRHEMGKKGMQKIQDQISWDHLARQRIKDYETALQAKGK